MLSLPGEWVGLMVFYLLAFRFARVCVCSRLDLLAFVFARVCVCSRLCLLAFVFTAI